ncbi:MAG: hypothetical protein RIS64_3332 [Bacteroidota bacterium]|jgi:hypothetical protein
MKNLIFAYPFTKSNTMLKIAYGKVDFKPYLGICTVVKTLRLWQINFLSFGLISVASLRKRLDKSCTRFYKKSN